MLRRTLLPIMLLAMPALAQKSAQQPATAPLAMLASLPAGLAGFARGGTTNYAAVDYRSPRGVTARVVLYDAGERQIGGSNTASLLEAQLRAWHAQRQWLS